MSAVEAFTLGALTGALSVLAAHAGAVTYVVVRALVTGRRPRSPWRMRLAGAFVRAEVDRQFRRTGQDVALVVSSSASRNGTLRVETPEASS